MGFTANWHYSLQRYTRTVLNLGFYRSLLRVQILLRDFLDNLLPTTLLTLFHSPKLHLTLPRISQLSPSLRPVRDFSFEIHSESFVLDSNTNWHQSPTRLQTFILNYFDWLRTALDSSLSTCSSSSSIPCPSIIDHWISHCPLGIGDPWHSYPTSLRLRNLFIFYTLYPSLLTRRRHSSLVSQYSWLSSHLELANGGNHLLENLITLCLMSVAFSRSSSVCEHYINKLIQELSSQLTIDGAHYESTASYHFLLLDHLVDLLCLLDHFSRTSEPLTRLCETLYIRAHSYQLSYSSFIRLNDSTLSSIAKPSIILVYSYLFLTKCTDMSLSSYLSAHSPTRSLLLPSSPLPKTFTSLLPHPLTTSNTSCHHPNSDISLLRLDDFELVFKCGFSVPRHLPGHSHSDQLSFDLFKSGQLIFAEAGTSTYENNARRHYERSSRAHNTIEFFLPSLHHDWINSLEVWSSFRAGYQPQIQNHYLHVSPESHSVYGSYHLPIFKLHHSRQISLCPAELLIIDTVDSPSAGYFNLWFHLGPNLELSKITTHCSSSHQQDLSPTVNTTHMAVDFNHLVPRKTLCFNGIVQPGIQHIATRINLSNV